MSESGGARALAWLRADLRRFDIAVATATVGIGTLLIVANPERFDTGWPEWVAGVGAFVLLVLRRRAPLPLLGVALVWTAGHVAVWERPTPMIFAVVVLLATACVRLETPRSAAASQAAATVLGIS